MASGIWKKPGRTAVLLILGLFLPLPVAMARVTVETVLEPSRVEVGATATLQIKISGADNAEPLETPVVKGLVIGQAGVSRSFQFVNGKTWSGITLSYNVTPEGGGKYTVPPIPFMADGARYRSRAVSLLAVRRGTMSGSGPQRLLTSVSLDRKRFYVGEPVILRYYLLHSGLSLDENPALEKLPQARGFLLKQIDEKPEEGVLSKNGRDLVRTHAATFILIPAEKGRHTVGGGSAIVTTESRHEFFSFPQRRRVKFETHTVDIQPLPEKGRPPRFEGAVGDFTLKAEFDGGPVRAMEEKKITVRIAGRGNLISLSRPYFEEMAKDVRVLTDESPAEVHLVRDGLEGAKTFTLTLIPEKSGTVRAGSILLPVFNPRRGSYETLKSPPISFAVREGASPSASVKVKGEEGMEVNWYLIALTLLAVCAAVAAVILWERKKYAQFTGGTEKREPDSPAAEREKGADGWDRGMRDMAYALRREDRVLFLKSAEKILNALAERVNSDGDDAGRMRLSEIRERLYAVKYGGAAADIDALRSMAAEINGFIRSLI